LETYISITLSGEAERTGAGMADLDLDDIGEEGDTAVRCESSI
jgi:hypothetical protein